MFSGSLRIQEQEEELIEKEGEGKGKERGGHGGRISFRARNKIKKLQREEEKIRKEQRSWEKEIPFLFLYFRQEAKLD